MDRARCFPLPPALMLSYSSFVLYAVYMRLISIFSSHRHFKFKGLTCQECQPPPRHVNQCWMFTTQCTPHSPPAPPFYHMVYLISHTIIYFTILCYTVSFNDILYYNYIIIQMNTKYHYFFIL